MSNAAAAPIHGHGYLLFTTSATSTFNCCPGVSWQVHAARTPDPPYSHFRLFDGHHIRHSIECAEEVHGNAFNRVAGFYRVSSHAFRKFGLLAVFALPVRTHSV